MAVIRVKHFRYITRDGRVFFILAIPADFGRLVTDKDDMAVPTEGTYMVVLTQDDSFIETDPVGWANFDRALMIVHFYLRDNSKEMRDRSVIREENIDTSVIEAIRAINPDLLKTDADAEKAIAE